MNTYPLFFGIRSFWSFNRPSKWGDLFSCNWTPAAYFAATVIVVFFHCTIAMAEQEKSISKVRVNDLERLRNFAATLPARTNINPGELLEQIAPVTLKTRIVGIGRSTFKLNLRWVNDWPAFFTAADGSMLEDKSKLLLLRGHAAAHTRKQLQRIKTKSVPLAAYVIETKDGLLLTAHFRARRQGRGRLHSYTLKLNLSNRSDNLQAEVLRASDADLHGMICGVKDGANHLSQTAFKPKGLAAASGNRRVQLATEADFEFFGKHGVNSNSVIAGWVNAAETIYDSSFDIDFTITQQNVHNSNAHPYTSTNADTLLSQFRDYTNVNDHLGWADLNHLFTGKDVDGATVGLAYLGVMCKTLKSRYSFTQDTGTNNEHFIFAHEAAHNFNATHDDSSPNIMNTTYNPAASGFSNQTVSEVEAHLTNFSSCLGVNAEPVQQITMLGEVNPNPPGGTKFNINLTSDQGWATHGFVDFLWRPNAAGAWQVLLDNIDFTAGSSGAATSAGSGDFKAMLDGTAIESGVVSVDANGNITNPTVTPTPTGSPSPTPTASGSATPTATVTATATPDPNLSVRAKFKKPRRNKFICIVKRSGKKSAGESAAMEFSASKAGPYSVIQTKFSSRKGTASFPTKTVPKKSYLRCNVVGTLSPAKKFRGIKRKR